MSQQPTAEGTPVVALDQLLPNTADPNNLPSNGKEKKHEPLFGPNIGSVSSGPAWTSTMDKKVVTDELTPDIVSGWIEKSKESSQPTTTLQALVNLKRPTLRLSPLSSVPEDPTSPNPEEPCHQHHHGLEFEYDCDAPKCGIYVHVYLPKAHPDAPPAPPQHPFSKLLVFDSVVEGGFSNHLKLEEGALLELGRFEHIPSASTSSGTAEASIAPADAPAGITPPLVNGDPSPNDVSATPATGRHNGRRRFSHFHFRRRPLNRSISGPALAVVDAEPAVQETKNKNGKEGGDNEGVKVTIRLAALDEQGTELSSPNEQITYLDIVRLGAKAADGEEGAEDTRPWVVKVVKREATIGPHTFHLHEIFGLTSSSTANHGANLTSSSPTHTYPPVENVPSTTATDDDSPQSECLLCLSSPREVVLLPCRHLVACKDCALNMVEFGAGGNITQAMAETATPTAGGGEADAAATPGAPATPAPINQRRKRKAKGWFCPVCRQPYSSLLRITTAPPPPLENKDDSGTEDEASPADPDARAAETTTEVRSGGLLGGTLRPGFLRGLSLSRGPQQTVRADIESTAGLGRVGV